MVKLYPFAIQCVSEEHLLKTSTWGVIGVDEELDHFVLLRQSF